LKPSSTSLEIRCRLYFQPAKAIEWDRPEWRSSGLLIGVLAGEPVDVLSREQQPHFHMANVLDDDGSVWKFTAQWGPLDNSHIEKLGDYLPTSIIEETRELMWQLIRENPEAYAIFIEPKSFIIERRDRLRSAWKGDKEQLEYLQQSVAANAGSPWKFNRGRIEIEARDLWTAVCILFLRDWESGRIGVCGNPDCPTPYYFKKKRHQKFCERGPCLNYGRKQNKRDWWARYGEEWRAKRRQNKKRARRSR
jgi:hypothetical protein